jgi:hypothetical protein
MPAKHEVLCINKSDRFDPHERITHIGGSNPDRRRWKITQEAAIQGIEDGKWTFFVTRAGKTAAVIVATTASGNKYLRTVADGVQPDNLLSLPECP